MGISGKSHPAKHLVSDSVGQFPHLRCHGDMRSLSLMAGDVLKLCMKFIASTLHGSK